MKYRDMTDADWPIFIAFAEENFVASHPIDRMFIEYWFRRADGSWSIQLAQRDDSSIAAVNMMVEAPGRLCGVKTPLTWMSTAIAAKDAQSTGIGGQLLFNAHRTLPLACCTCANEKTLPINETLGLDFPGLMMRRFVCLITPECLQIVKKESRNQAKHILKPLMSPDNTDLQRVWTNVVPDGYEELWEAFSEHLFCLVERNREYMNRRYIDVPYQNYHLLAIRDRAEKLNGLSIIRFHSTPYGECARIVDFMALPGSETDVWRHTLHACFEKKSLYADFIIMGTGQDLSLLEAGFTLATDQNGLEDIPNLLSPIDYRRWSYTFHISGTLPREHDGWRENDKVWFTKGDGDRDWPTIYDLNRLGTIN
jgi:hypothetical protein